MKSVSIIILSYNNTKYMKDLAHSLERTVSKEAEIVIVDNGSDRKTWEFLLQFQKKRPGTKVICLSRNRGYSAGNNIGAQMAGGEYLVFLNNDMVALKGWLEPLVGELKKKTTGIAGAKLVFPDRAVQHAGLTAFFNMYPLSRNYRMPVKEDRESKPLKVMAVTGACLAIRKDFFHKLGGFNEKYALVFQDLDLCFKALAQGKDVVYRPDSKMIHYQSVSLNNVRKQRVIDSDWALLKNKWASGFKKIIRKTVFRLKKELKSKKLLVYGTGSMARMLSGELKTHGIRVDCYSDSDKAKWGHKFQGRKIISPEAINSVENAKVLIASGYRCEIEKELKRHRIRAEIVNGFVDEKVVIREIDKSNG